MPKNLVLAVELIIKEPVPGVSFIEPPVKSLLTAPVMVSVFELRSIIPE
ncbi:hypothetical protein N9242_02380 [Vicingaceae bacterium]|nr:hypothetical protein [Vicingaceae bacterium]